MDRCSWALKYSRYSFTASFTFTDPLTAVLISNQPTRLLSRSDTLDGRVYSPRGKLHGRVAVGLHHQSALLSGVRLLEESSEKRYGQDPEFIAHTRRTSKVVLWFPRKATVASGGVATVEGLDETYPRIIMGG
ncbi:hypothetical protein BC830DRAFT_1079575 [Chytriomyces sp. MP71]|nr:hypothetical protein BC830DRAFT_1079575 [Chytriomyces sp. MP71]